MKYLLLFAGLVCCIVGLFLRNDPEQKTKSNVWLTVGATLTLVMFCYLLADFIGIIIAFVYLFYTVRFKGWIFFGDNPIWENNGMKWNLDEDNIKWWLLTVVFTAFIILLSFLLRYIPPVTLNNNVIEMSGKYGGSFNISDMQSIDTVSVIPKQMYRKGGANGPKIHYGNFEVQNEKGRAKLRIYRNKPPYIKIRMNDNSLFLLNFKEPEKTVEFYDELKNIINSN